MRHHPMRLGCSTPGKNTGPENTKPPVSRIEVCLSAFFDPLF